MEALVKNLLDAYNTGSIVLCVSVVLMIVVFILNAMFGDHIPKKSKPLFASALGVLTSVAIALASGIEWYLAVVVGLLVGTSAGGHWSLWGRYVCSMLAYDDYVDVNDD